MKFFTKEKKLIAMLTILCGLLFILLIYVLYRNNYFSIFMQISTSNYDYKNNAQYTQRQTLFEILPETKADIVFVGDSITARCEWQEFFPNLVVQNRGIDSDVTEGVKNRLHIIKAAQPDKIFIMIGINDIRQKISVSTTVEHYEQIVQQLKDELPDTEIYIQSVLPIGNHTGMSNQDVETLNTELQMLAARKEVTYIDIYSLLLDETGYLPDKYSIDGVHLTGDGYSIWIEAINNYIH